MIFFFKLLITGCKDFEISRRFADRSFCIIHLCSGDQGGKYTDKHINTDTPAAIDKYLEALKDAMAQAVVWYYSNIIATTKN